LLRRCAPRNDGGRKPDLITLQRRGRELAQAAPLIEACQALYGEALALGLADLDMVAVLRAFEQRAARPA
jgi:3-hydroxyisobutyrate dehydrogenase-like beta-hydroxyacid dehydrogenase